MLEVSKKGSKSSPRNVGKHLIQLWINEDRYQQIKKAAESAEEPVTTWIRRAVFTMLRKWVIPESKILYEPCSMCGKRHDRTEHLRESP
jgi:hypothetical protein